MRVIESDLPYFYECAAVIKKHLPYCEITKKHKIIVEDNRYYGLLKIQGKNAVYDHIILDKTVCNPEFIFKVLTFIFSEADICNVFVVWDNIPSQKFTNGLGFTQTGILRQIPDALFMYSMTIQEWQKNKIRRHFCNSRTNSKTNIQ